MGNILERKGKPPNQIFVVETTNPPTYRVYIQEAHAINHQIKHHTKLTPTYLHIYTKEQNES